MKYSSQPLNVHGVNNFRQIEIHTTEPLVAEPSFSEFELDIGNLKILKSPGIGK
jgi:dihydroorotase